MDFRIFFELNASMANLHDCFLFNPNRFKHVTPNEEYAELKLKLFISFKKKEYRSNSIKYKTVVC